MSIAVVAPTLVENEAIIERGLTYFIETGEALLRIQDARQYREAGYSDFETYCRERGGLARSTAYQYLDAARVVSAIADIDTPPISNEAQARELVSTLREEGAEAVAAVLEEAVARGPLTARSIAEVVAERKPAHVSHNAGDNEWYTPKAQRIPTTVVLVVLCWFMAP